MAQLVERRALTGELSLSHARPVVRVVWAMMLENPSTGLTCRWVPPKMGINKNNFGYILPMCPKPPPPWTDMHLIWHSRRGRRRDHLWQYFGDRLRGDDSVWGRKLLFPIGGSESMEQSSRYTATAWRWTRAVQTTFNDIFVWRGCSTLVTFCF